jgi:hypothetical protein
VKGTLRDVAEQPMETTMLKTLAALTAVVTISGLLSTNEADAYNRHVDIVNNSDRVITEFHASNIGENMWGPDLLGPIVLAPGDDVDLDLDDGTGYCRFDFLTITENGRGLVHPRVNVCEVARYQINN